MHIIFLSDNFPPERNAAASRVYERACYWVRWGHRVTVITSAPNFPEGKIYEGYCNRWYQVEIIDGIRVARVKTFIARNEGVLLRALDFISFMISAFWAGLVQPKPDVIVSTSPQFFTAVSGWTLSIFRRVPFVFELGDLWPASISAVEAIRHKFILRQLERLELFLYQRSALVVALTPAFKENLVRRGVPRQKVTVVINGVDLNRYSPQPPDQTLLKKFGLVGCFVVGYLGTHGMAHALERVLDAAELLQDSPAVRFLFMGSGAAREAIITEATKRRLNNVVFVPAQPKEKMPSYWSICDVALVHLKNVPLFSTVIPSKIFEAMAMGVGILLAAPEGEASCIVREAGAGVVVPPEEPNCLAAAVRVLHRDKTSLARFRKNALFFAPRFSRESQAREMIIALERVANPNKYTLLAKA